MKVRASMTMHVIVSFDAPVKSYIARPALSHHMFLTWDIGPPAGSEPTALTAASELPSRSIVN